MDLASIVYHVSNECYKKYTLKKTLESIQNSTDINDNSKAIDMEHMLEEPFTRSKSTPHALPSSHDVDMYRKDCIICSFKKHQGDYIKYRISEGDRAGNFLKAAVYFQDKLYVRICDLENTEAVFGADIYYHENCMRTYLNKYNRAIDKSSISGTDQGNRFRLT